MNKTVHRIQLAMFIVTIVELALLIIFGVFYYLDLFELQSRIMTTYVYVTVAVLVIANFLAIWICLWRIGKIRRSTDLQAAEIIGNDVQEAYNFGMLGLVVTDHNDSIIWISDLFQDRHINIIDMNILSWQPALKELKENPDSSKTVKVVVNLRSYEVEFLPDADLWIFRDITENELNIKNLADRAPVVGILAIDNYQEILHDEDDFNDTLSNIRTAILNYAAASNALIRRIKEDSYLLVMDFKSLETMRANKFSVVDQVRGLGASGKIPLTISIGIAYNSDSITKLNEQASEALEIAESRGGDQVVLAPVGEDMEFVGGKTEAQEKRNKVKVRVLADSLVSLISSSSKVFIMGHQTLDLDAFGACLGIKAICNHLKKYAKIVIDPKSLEAKTRAAMNSSFTKDELDDLCISPKDAKEGLSADSLLVVVDVHMPSLVMAPDLIEASNKIVVIDHHRRAEEYIENPVFNHIEPSASSSCELVSELIQYAASNPRINLPSIYATFMLSGIFLDSKYLRSRQTSMRTFDACSLLKDYGADNSLADDFLKDDYEEYRVVSSLLSNTQTPTYGIVIAEGSENSIYEMSTLAKAADQLLTIKGNKAAFVIGRVSQKEIRISCRSDGTYNVQLVAEKLGGGGHLAAAAVSVEKTTIKDVGEILKKVLEENMSSIKVDIRSRGERLGEGE